MNKLEQAARQLLEAVKSLPPRKGLLHAAFALEKELHRQDHSADAGNKVSDHIAGGGKVILPVKAAQQIEEALDELRYANNTDIAKTKYYKALSTIRAARAQEQAEHEPVAYALSHLMGLEFGSKYPMQETKEAAEQMARQHMGAVVVTPLYAAPVRTKDLTDSELDALWNGNTEGGWRGLFRAVIAADREKNRG